MAARSDDDATAALRNLEAAKRRLLDAEDAHREAATEFAGALLRAHRAGNSWSAVAEAAQLASAETARIRAQRAKQPSEQSPSFRWRVENGAAPRPETPQAGVGVTEAARLLGVTRQTVYVWIGEGRLETVQGTNGRTRVLLDEAQPS